MYCRNLEYIFVHQQLSTEGGNNNERQPTNTIRSSSYQTAQSNIPEFGDSNLPVSARHCLAVATRSWFILVQPTAESQAARGRERPAPAPSPLSFYLQSKGLPP